MKQHERLQKAKDEIAKAEAAICMTRSRRKILCSCNEKHEIRHLDAVQTHWYVQPHGCMEGDYWKPGELHFVCPSTGMRNRILFAANDRLEEQFSRLYYALFNSVRDEYDDEKRYARVNNYYVSEHAAAFELGVEAPHARRPAAPKRVALA